ncbi:DUF4148 domain-containing protein [Paraburkholderia saeva]|uniref:DUF4148 domain-containing protein n=1 Tax=Paraburkholderia saeva TaxID=2777537 RepID=A0A9N8S2S8_9BURK|nr:DUF4148 domain-containing protein [Paraburkholderia saeva]CAG4926119.1 hypothetical protein LMG31841_05555 [Paraburkholderia saeva]
MKTFIIAVALAVSAAYAADSSVAGMANPATIRVDQAPTHSRTRAEVKAELVQAEKSGQLAYLDGTLYRGGN